MADAVYVRLDPLVVAQVRALAEADRRNVTEWVRVAIMEKIEREVVRA